MQLLRELQRNLLEPLEAQPESELFEVVFEALLTILEDDEELVAVLKRLY